MFSRAIDAKLHQLPAPVNVRRDVFDVLNQIPKMPDEPPFATGIAPPPKSPLVPASLLSEVRLIPVESSPVLPMRQVQAPLIGHLVRVGGVVLRCTEVQPLATVITYTCDRCGCETFQEISSRHYMPLTTCASERCRLNKTVATLVAQTRGTKFVSFQESREVPVGHIPRQLVLHMRGDLAGQLHPGDEVEVAGIFLPLPQTGFRAMRAGLLTDTYLQVHQIRMMKERFQKTTFAPEQYALVQRLSSAKADVYSTLAEAIAPDIYGHSDVKKALLLLMVGGPTRFLGDIAIRGDLNICLMGDPGVAKSQLLKQVTRIAPRAIYTTGKGSSGVGLTAAVLRDKTTGEMHLEGGALVMADRGVCCIDEFDKMEDTDKTAIHEVMEQQTVSLAKGGITTTLNARTSILAAANPISGRYNRRKSPWENINLPGLRALTDVANAALLSRFDLLFLLIDTPDSQADRMLAQHVINVHRHARDPDAARPAPEATPDGRIVVDQDLLRAYISEARRIETTVPPQLRDKIVEHYVAIRRDEEKSDQPYTYTSPRTLLSILRLSQALVCPVLAAALNQARLRFDKNVIESDVDEALRLMDATKAMLHRDTGPTDRSTDVLGSIYQIIRECFRSELGTAGGETRTEEGDYPSLRYSDVLEHVVRAGHSKENLDVCLRQYQELAILRWSDDHSWITWI